MEMEMLIDKQKIMIGVVFSLPNVPFSDTGFICLDELLSTFFLLQGWDKKLSSFSWYKHE